MIQSSDCAESKSSGTCDKKIAFVDLGWLDLFNTFQMFYVEMYEMAYLYFLILVVSSWVKKEASAVIMLYERSP